jgi:Ca2+-transporting ATPase
MGKTLPLTQRDENQWHLLDGEQSLAHLASDADNGLSAAEAQQRLQEYGPNRLQEASRASLIHLFINQFRDLMIQVLLAAAVIAVFLGEPQDAIAILVIVVLNALIGVVQQYRAENAMAALREMAAPAAQVLRDGYYQTLPAAELVPGDIVMLESGAVVPADLRLLEAMQLQVDESMLTGESLAVEKSSAALAAAGTALGDRLNMAYRSTLVTRGRGRGVVVATGMRSEIGGIAGMLSDVELLDSPLKRRLTAFSKRLAFVILGVCALIFVAGMLRGEPWLLMLLTAVSLAVAAIPEALPAVVSISLAMGARRMGDRNALVRSLPAVETLGSVSVICSDKTGTLTMNRMSGEVAVSAMGSVDLLPHNEPSLAAPWRLFGQALALSNDVQVTAEHLPLGDPTEVALYEMAAIARFQKLPLQRELPRVAEIPFSSERKQMSTLHRKREDKAERIVLFSKGAPEKILDCCDGVLTQSGSAELDLAYWRAEVERLSCLGYRVLALACRELPELPEGDLQQAERNLKLLGLVALIDPPRPGAIEAVAQCSNAGITTVMITGDHPGTAAEIARRLGIGDQAQAVLTGSELDQLDDQELLEQVARTHVYARVSPAHKLRLVKALQSRGQFIAMTGDGVNDAPALRQADIGVAMGQKGTDVARQAASMILLDDNFSTIVAAVREGRRIFDNIRKFVKYTMTSNAGEILTLALAPLLGMPLSLLPIHILWINLVTDGLPGLALTTQPEEPNVMRCPPRPPNESLFAHGMWQHILVIGLLIGGVSLGVQYWAIERGLAHWQTMVFTVLTFSQLAHVLVIRNNRDSFFLTGLFQNPALLGAVALTVALQLAVIYLPLLNGLFRTAPLSPQELLICCAAPLVIVVAVEIEKWLVRRGWIYQ